MQLSNQDISDWGQAALKIDAGKWRHGETEHFIIHYFQRGQKIATRCETFYQEIRTFFGNRADQLGKQKSHIYAFHQETDWQQFAALTRMGDIAGVTRDHEFFYIATDPTGHFDTKGHVQAHEMTHLVFNRFFHGQPPLWLNEGIAEYFGQRETSTATEFRRMMAAMGRFPLDSLFEATTYPAMTGARRGFYGEASVLVDFLTYQDDRRKLLPKFVDAMIEKNALDEALKIYGYQSLGDFKDKYERYRKTRFR